MASQLRSSGPVLNDMIPGTISSGLVQKSYPSASYVSPSRNDWDLLFRPLFDELLNPPPSVVNQAVEVIVPIAENPRGIFINQSKYALESLKKYGFESYDPVDTPMVEKSKLDEDKEGKAVDPSHYRGLWYPKDSSVALIAFADANYAGCQDTRRSTSGTGSESRPPMLNKENYIPWSSRLLRYAKSRPNGKLIHNSILNCPYVRKMIPEPDIYAAVNSCETAQEIWLRVQQIMKGSDIGIQEKKEKLFNEWERFTSNEGESIESYYHRFLKLMNDLKRNKHFPEKIASNLKFLNNLQPEWSRHVTIIHQTKDLHTADYTQLYDFLKYNQNENGLMGVQENANQNQIGNGNFVVARAEGNAAGQNENQIRCYNCRGIEARIQLQAEEYDLMAAAADLDDIEEVNANCILMANLQQASTLGTQSDSAPVYDTDGSAELHKYYDDNEIFNMFTQEEQYTEILEPIPELHQVPQNDNDVVSEVIGVEQGGEIVEQHPVNFKETRALYDSLYQNLATEVKKVNSINHKLRETNAELTTKLARYKNQERCFQINQEKYNKLERCYQQSVYQEQCLSKKINALHLSTGKQIMTLNEQISDLNKQLSKEKSTVSFLLDEKKRLKSDFKTSEEKLLDKQIQLEKKIKELNNIVFKTGQAIQTIHMLSPKPDSIYHTEHKMALGYQNPFYLKHAQKKQQSLYDGKMLLDKHDPPVVHDSEETLQLAQESRDKMKQMNKK
nr:hypothetical protein [Tanacetum cinerariifolium]